MLNIVLKRRYDKFNYSSGDKFGRLTLTGETYIKQAIGHRGRVVEAVCTCGAVRWYWFHLLRNGETQSCGCLRKDVSKKRMTTHNLSDHKLYFVYNEMVSRCHDETDKAFKNYGARGIEVWMDWRDDFVCFYEWAIENGYEEGLSLDREDNDGNYAPYNCRWATTEVQSRNRRSNRMFTAFGETKCLFDWGKDSRCKVTVWALRGRMDKEAWKDRFEEALTIPPSDMKKVGRGRKNNLFLTAFGETKCMSEWLEDKRCVVKLDTLRGRYRKGWEHEDCLTIPPKKMNKS